jgi:peroxiredoxin
MDAFRVSYEMPEYLRPDFGGERFLQVNPGTGWKLPIPATFVIGRDGTVRARWVSGDYRYRMEPDDVVAAVRKAATSSGD